MNDLLQQLIGMGPGLGAAAAGNGPAFAAFMDGFERARQQDEQRKRLHQQDSMAMQDRDLALQDRERNIERQGAQDERAAQDQTWQNEQRRLQVAGQLSQAAGGAESVPDGEASIDTLFRVLSPEMQSTMAPARDAALSGVQRTVTGRQKKQVEAYVDAALKTSFVADNPDADPEMQLPEHMQRILGKPSARLSELQSFAQLPVGKPAGKTRIPPAAGSMEEFSDPNITPERKAAILADRKAYMQSDDRAPRVTVNTGGLNANQGALLTEKLAKTWNDANSSSREMKRSLSLMDVGLKRFRQGDKNGGSQAVLVTFQKILDPTSVVRETEYARSAQGISMLARLQGMAERLQAGGAGVPDAELAAMVETARAMLSEMESHSSGQRSRIEAMAKKYQIDPVLIFGMEPPAQAPPAAPPSADPNASQSRPKNAPRKNPFRP
jgi:hypothetical protein